MNSADIIITYKPMFRTYAILGLYCHLSGFIKARTEKYLTRTMYLNPVGRHMGVKTLLMQNLGVLTFNVFHRRLSLILVSTTHKVAATKLLTTICLPALQLKRISCVKNIGVRHSFIPASPYLRRVDALSS